MAAWSPVLGVEAAGSPAPTAPRPNIVMIYMDDFSPLAAELWSRPSRTPALARLVEEGIELNATASTPLCCPARGNLLTGRYGHRNGITRIDMRDYDPTETIAVELQAAGYHTAYVGKFLNTLARWAPERRSVRVHAQGWHDFDVIWENQGRFYDYRLWTRDGVRRYGRA
ncbi:MAG: sulfatase-like hydrolase/transferase, partial [Thermoleophilaceae bacterium]